MFVRVSGSPDGTGRLVDLAGTTGEIEYFVSPVGPQLVRRSAPVAKIEAYELPGQTPIYWLDLEHREWRLGRVAGGLVAREALRSLEDAYDIRFPNEDVRHIPCSEVFVRWAHPIPDPTDLLAQRVTESPFFAAGRERLLKHLASQRAAFGGMTALATAAIEYHPHQIAVVRRVLADPVQRYLLADEVGLGKTIEAGLLIRQHIEEQRDARVLVLTPDHLTSQWRGELVSKFALARFPAVKLLPFERLPSTTPPNLAAPTMLVVDEAHRVASWAWSSDPDVRARYAVVDELARRAPRVLLLTGTPLLHDEDGFLAMLHLLDPTGYPLSDREAFHRRVAARQAIAQSVADLEDEATPFFLEDAIKRLRVAFNDDVALATLCDRLTQVIHDDPESQLRREAIRALRAHVVDTYRLHRRLLRTRRDQKGLGTLLPVRVGVEWLPCTDPAREAGEAFLEEWRLSLPGIAYANEQRLFQALVDAALSHPRVLLGRIDQRVKALSSSVAEATQPPRPAFSEEVSLLERWSRALALEVRTDARVGALHRWLRDKRREQVVLFVDDPDVALATTRALNALGAPTKAVQHDRISTAPLDSFRKRVANVLVCDRVTEEGLNLQDLRATVVFLDLPLDTGRIEQRLGRVDRLAGMRHVRVLGFSPAGPYERLWQQCLLDPIGVFRRSTATLQYVLADATHRIRTNLAEYGPRAFEMEAELLRSPASGLEAEARRIRSQETLEELTWDLEEEAALAQRADDAREDARLRGPEAFGDWLEKSLGFQRDGIDVFHYVHLQAGYQPRGIPLPKQPTLIPREEALADFGDYKALNYVGTTDQVAFGPFTFSSDEVDERTTLIRVGHPFVAGIERMLAADVRGRAWVVWRYLPGWRVDGARLFYCFQFVLEGDIEPAYAIFGQRGFDDRALGRMRDQVLPPEHATVWVSADGKVEARDQILALLNRPYCAVEHGGTDTNVRGDGWLAIGESVPLVDWTERCLAARNAAEDWVRSRPEFRERCQAGAEWIRANAAERAQRSQVRLSRLEGSARDAEASALELEAAVASALARGALAPSARVDAAGAVFLSPARPSWT